jgi:hypothetical protein
VLKVNSARLVSELKTFVWNNGRASAMKGYNDDLAMAAAIACWVRETAIVVNTHEAEYKKALLGAMMTSRTSINTNLKGMKDYKNKNSRDKMNDTKDFSDLPFFMK